MQAIQTEYMGYLFRSRLEARWAVFFDLLGLNWQYEVEGFDLGGAGYYLPDFKVISPDGYIFWYEVKPKGVTTDSKFEAFKALYRAESVRESEEWYETMLSSYKAWEASGREGPKPSRPPERDSSGYWYFQLLSGDPVDFLETTGMFPGGGVVGGVCPRCGHLTDKFEYGIGLVTDDRKDGFEIGCEPCDFNTPSQDVDVPGLFALTSPYKGFLRINSNILYRHSVKMLGYARAARSARFEHGECGVVK